MRNINCLLGLILFFVTGLAHAVTLAVDDSFGVPFGQPLQVEFPGVLANDTIDGIIPEDGVLVAELVTGVTNGILSCPSNTALQLCADGSFDYLPGLSFSGSDSFTYRAISDTAVSTPATVTLTACTGGPQIFSCWLESSYLAKLAESGYGTFLEGFEGVAWDAVRSTFSTINSAPDITSQGITWTSNHPLTNNITTGEGPALSGLWGGFDPNHGFATGTLAECDVDIPPPTCLFYDGLSGTILPGGDKLQGVGGYITGITGANIAIIIDDTTQIDIGKLPDPGHYFFGLIDTSAAGFSNFEFRELDGKVGQERFIFGDDFIIATSTFPDVPLQEAVVDFGAGHGVWHYLADVWSQIHGTTAVYLQSFDIDGNGQSDAIVDFGALYGLWAYLNNNTWSRLHNLTTEGMNHADLDDNGQDDLVIDFGNTFGIWKLMNNNSWQKLHNLSAVMMASADIDNNGQDEIIVDFGSPYGLWVWKNNAAWEKLHNLSTTYLASGDIDNNGQDEVIASFDSPHGLWIYQNNSTWRQIHSFSSRQIVTGDLDGNNLAEVIVDFGDQHGIWGYMNNSNWTQLHNITSEQMVTRRLDNNNQVDLLIDFGSPYGLWVWKNNSTWEKLHDLSPTVMGY